MDLSPTKTIIKIVLLAIGTAITIILSYNYLSNMALVSGGVEQKEEIKLTPEGKRESSW